MLRQTPHRFANNFAVSLDTVPQHAVAPIASLGYIVCHIRNKLCGIIHIF